MEQEAMLKFLEIERGVTLLEAKIKVMKMKGAVSQFGTYKECVAYNQAIQDVIDILEKEV